MEGGHVPVEGIELIQLPVENFPRARAFYERVLGRAPEATNPDAPGAAAPFALPARSASLYLQRPPAPGSRPDGLVVVFQIRGGADAEALLRNVEGAGGTITYRERRHPGLLNVGFKDTERNDLELIIPR